MSNALTRPVYVSPELGAVIAGSDSDPALTFTRADIAKRVWNYIKANGLQNPANKRMIRADDKLRPIFDGRDEVSMFEMTQLVNKHIRKTSPTAESVDDDENVAHPV